MAHVWGAERASRVVEGCAAGRLVFSAFLPSVRQLGGFPGPNKPLYYWQTNCEKTQNKTLRRLWGNVPPLSKGRVCDGPAAS